MVQADPEATVSKAFMAVADALVEVIAARSDDDDAGPVIDRSGGQGKRRLPVAK